MEFGLDRLLVVVVAASAIAEEDLGTVGELFLLLADLDVVDLIRLGEFGDGPGLPGGLLGDFDLEGGRMPHAWDGHDVHRDELATFDQYNIPRRPENEVRFTSHVGFLGEHSESSSYSRLPAAETSHECVAAHQHPFR